MIKLTGLWKNTSKDGKEYWSGNLGSAKIMVFENDKKGNDKAPDYNLVVGEQKKKDATGKITEVFSGEDVPF